MIAIPEASGYTNDRNGHSVTARADRQPPRSIELEESVIGSCLSDAEALRECVDILTADDFFRATNRAVWAVMAEMQDAGRKVDYVTVADELEQRGNATLAANLELFGRYGERSIPWHAVEYAHRIRELAKYRECIAAAEDMLNDAFGREQTADELRGRCEDRLNRLAVDDRAGGIISLADTLPKVMERYERRARGELLGVSTPWMELNSMTCGFEPGDLVVVGARPSQGKSAFALNLCEWLSWDAPEDVQRPSMFVSLEMKEAGLGPRLMSSQARVDGHKLRLSLPLDERERGRINHAMWRVQGCARICLVEKQSADLRRIVADCRAACRRERIGLVVIDYLQMIAVDGRHDNRQQEIAKISRRLKVLAGELGVPVVVLSQLNRKSEDREDRKPRMSDLRESGAIEQDADVVLLMHSLPDRAGVTEIEIAKQRNGPVGDFKLMFNKAYSRFEEMPEVAPPIEAFNHDRPF